MDKEYLYLALKALIKSKSIIKKKKPKKISIHKKEIKMRRIFIQRKIVVLDTGFPYKYDFKKPQINFNNFQKVIMIGRTSLSLLKCALGKYDWYNEKNIMIWDIIVGVHFNLINKCKIKKFKINKICQEVSLGYCY